MNAVAENPLVMHEPPLNLMERAGLYTSWVLSGAVFLSVGWLAVAPDDPYGAVSLYARTDGLSMLVQAAALVAVVASLGAALGGRRLVDAGTLTATLGLAVVSLRGATSEYLLLYEADHGGSQRALGAKFLFESIGWFFLVVIALVVSGLVARWVYGRDVRQDEGLEKKTASHNMAPRSSLHEMRLLWGGAGSAGEDARFVIGQGLRHTVVTAAVGLIAMMVLSTGLSSRVIQSGQVCFLVAASTMIGEYFAARRVPVRSAFWAILAVAIMALIGYVWSAMRPVYAALPPHIPTSHFLRILPLQFISVGTISAIWSFQHFHDAAHATEGEGGEVV